MLSYVLTLIGIIIFFIQNIFVFLKFPRFNFKSLTTTTIKSSKERELKKEPIIKNNLNFHKEDFNTDKELRKFRSKK